MTAVSAVKHDNPSKIKEPIYIQVSRGSSPASAWDPTTFSLTLAGRQAESRNPYDPVFSTVHPI